MKSQLIAILRRKVQENKKLLIFVISKKIIVSLILLFLSSSCISTKSTLKNVDDNAPLLRLAKDNTFIITEYSKNKKYGYDKDYPINIFYYNTYNEQLNEERFLNALAGPKGEKISFTKLETCCPFPTKRSAMGAGFLNVYEIRWEGQKKPVVLYLNIYEKGVLMCPTGLSIRKKE
ncbi:2-dehydro-3-deoxyphosphooctonate aldolase [Flavobacterium palustre]|uniref:2-dehydro-3-deoxyphosphooctonate aldolase n=1 Tax=Flavobacterium palustre TaxID=1476463 RepID=A0ABQ1HTX3_9FLAO|nr:2-dehydro-3-deoxyphosphooctonate aldolase [Flavobacterium palustre]GGA88468.1 2-dehydro-3-deoxyphosphooctonate aldolase [Flavobacterium palustre]